MKKTDLAKNLGLKISLQMKQSGTPGRFGTASTAVPDRREQRKLDQAAGLVPFAVKLHADLVKQLQTQAEQEGISLHVLTDRVIRAGLGSSAGTPVAPAATVVTDKAPVAKKAAAKKAVAEKPVATKTAEKPPEKVAAKKAPAKKIAAKKAATKKAVTKA